MLDFDTAPYALTDCFVLLCTKGVAAKIQKIAYAAVSSPPALSVTSRPARLLLHRLRHDHSAAAQYKEDWFICICYPVLALVFQTAAHLIYLILQKWHKNLYYPGDRDQQDQTVEPHCCPIPRGSTDGLSRRPAKQVR